MATYNGEKYLKEQINSIRNQTFQEWELLIRDDGSTDHTMDIIAYYLKLDSRIKLIEKQGNIGAKGSFFQLLRRSTAPFFMFSDQDDVWKKDKIVKSINLIKDFDDVPVLGFTGLCVVDVNLKKIRSSKRVKIKDITFEKLLLENQVTGATIIGNKALRDKVMETENLNTSFISMHDWWITLVASQFGVVKFLDEDTMMYRQHDANVLGASVSRYSKLKKVNKICYFIDNTKKDVEGTFIQAQYFWELYKDDIDLNTRKLFDIILKKKKINFGLKLKFLSKKRVHGVLQNLFFIIKII
ncbi:glycosyltransferase family 2 protein [Dellaglioa algida]|nr:glycosyltransferase family 2 protein [Dellaglioa algida]MDK1732058.1 glycosyltransferase family 2 protein [Dellaglioa algida]MDK1733584.1 glycosyltransferase family 2 protein [Dellaglioa algida]